MRVTKKAIKMIISFNIQNFGSIRDKQTLSFEADKSKHLENQYIINPVKGVRLLKLGLIYGANASGKTSILRALDFLRDLVIEPEEKKTAPLKFNPFLFEKETPSMPTKLSITFIQNGIKYFYEVEFNRTAILKEVLYNYNPSKACVYNRITDLEKQYSQIKFGSKFSIDKSFKKTLESNTLWNNTVLGGFLKTNIELKELKDVTDWFENYLKPIVLSNTELDDYVTAGIESSAIDKKDILRILKKADFNISDIIINEEVKELDEKMIKVLDALELPESTKEKIKSSPLKKLALEHSIDGSVYSLPFNFESQGTQRYYGFAGLLALLIKGSTAIPIDELESSLHPDLFTHFILSFLVNSRSSQLIATTHNREILNDKDIFRNDAIWFTNKNEKCATELYSLSDFDSSVIRDTSNVYNAYKIGKLGGVPKLSDYYIDLNNEN